MSNTTQIIPERNIHIGNFLVGRILPFRQKRMVGPFIFIDHMGPATLGPEEYLDIGQHPHIGLSTLTYLFEGCILHRDSIGTIQKIQPGEVNLMTAGKGVVHTERTPVEMRNGKTHKIHGFQIWLALPKEKEFCEPEFQHVGQNEIPTWQDNNLQFKLIAGQGFQKTSPVQFFWPMFLLEVKSTQQTKLNISNQLEGEIGICVISGGLQVDNQTIEAGYVAISDTPNQCHIEVKSNTHLLIFGGKPFEEERFIDWNFVASSKETIKQARENWKNRNFKFIDGETEIIELPKLKF